MGTFARSGVPVDLAIRQVAASEWNVTGWPSIYILDENGVIRHAQKRHAEVIVSVNELLWDLQRRQREQGTET